jgi:hypothetical protein
VQNLGLYDVSVITSKQGSNNIGDVETIEVLIPISRIREAGLRIG